MREKVSENPTGSPHGELKGFSAFVFYILYIPLWPVVKIVGVLVRNWWRPCAWIHGAILGFDDLAEQRKVIRKKGRMRYRKKRIEDMIGETIIKEALDPGSTVLDTLENDDK
ncbi:MAG: hypothetical protein AAFX77_18510 [Pseudomonadota bacterium]